MITGLLSDFHFFHTGNNLHFRQYLAVIDHQFFGNFPREQIKLRIADAFIQIVGILQSPTLGFDGRESIGISSRQQEDLEKNINSHNIL